MPVAYRTVSAPGSHAFEVRGSVFHGRVEPAADQPTAEAAIERVRQQHPDATHVVPAYRIRSDPFRAWASDDGEPRGSAGDPVLRVLAGRELENVVATVARYYGGTNLGIGGLVRAYTAAVNGALDATTIVERRPLERMIVETMYDDSGRVRAVLEGSDATFSATYEERVTFEVAVPVDRAEGVRERLRDVTSGRVDIDAG